MNGPRERAERRFRRILGADEETRARLKEVNDAATDWWAVCRKCGKRLTGTPAQIAAHECNHEAS